MASAGLSSSTRGLVCVTCPHHSWHPIMPRAQADTAHGPAVGRDPSSARLSPGPLPDQPLPDCLGDVA